MITDHQSIERTTVSFMKRMGVELDATTPFIELDNYYQALLYHFLRERFYLEKPHASKYWFTTQYFIDHIHSTLVPFIKECENETTVLTHPWLYKNFIVTQPTIIVQAPVGMGGDFLATLIHNHVYDHKQISFGEGVERTFALYSPIVGSIKVIRSGQVRRAKLYYLRDRKGKSARISEKIKKKIGIDISEQTVENKIVKEEPKKEAPKAAAPKAEPKKAELKKEKLKTEKK